MGIVDGKAVVVTGAGRGLGRAYARHAAGEGAAVVVNDIDGEVAESVTAEIRAAGGRAVASAHSVRDADQAAAVVDRCLAEFGTIDGLVNNAAVVHEAPPWEETPQLARELIETNVLGTLNCGLAAVAAMRARGAGGVIVNIASGAAFGQRSIGTYAASKGAVIALTASWALDLEDDGIRVNAVCPSAWTRMVSSSARAQRRCPPERSPDLVAPLITYLLADRSLGVTGQVFRFTGQELHVVRQLAVKEPVLRRDSWTVDSVATAVENELAGVLEPYGLEKRAPSGPRPPAPPEPSVSPPSTPARVLVHVSRSAV